SVHQARVATRRLREVLPLAAPGNPGAEEVEQIARETTRALGRVRELDVNAEKLEALTERVPRAAAAAGAARSTLAIEQQRARRKLIKALERLELERHLRRRPRRISRWTSFSGLVPFAASPAHELRERVASRARELDDAVSHATGVYFPRRMHSVRIAAKKL